MSIPGDCYHLIDCVDSDVLQLSTLKPKQPKPKPPTLQDALLKALPEGEAAECIAWASQHYVLKSEYHEDGIGRLQSILDRWNIIKAQRLKWSVLPTPIPSLSSPNPITVADLHTYLSEILAIHPLVATIPVYHEECCGPSETGEIEFDEEKGILNFY
jgi:hypothetical protein